MADASVFVGVDVAEAEFVAALAPTGERWAVRNEPTAVRDLVARLQALDGRGRGLTPSSVVQEARARLNRPNINGLRL
jgi:hypothetical protein